MGILHFLGLDKHFHGLFANKNKSSVIKLLKNDDQDFSQIVKLLKIKEDKEFIITEKLLEIGNSQDIDFLSLYKKRLSEIENTDLKKLQGLARKEQAILRAILFKDLDEIQCSLCHQTFPSEIMITAHIKPRSKCSHEERLDPNIVMPVCKIGCDDLFEKGFLIVDQDGIMKSNTNKNIPDDLKIFMKRYDGKTCKSFSKSTKKYFEFKQDLIKMMKNPLK